MERVYSMRLVIVAVKVAVHRAIVPEAFGVISVAVVTEIPDTLNDLAHSGVP